MISSILFFLLGQYLGMGALYYVLLAMHFIWWTFRLAIGIAEIAKD